MIGIWHAITQQNDSTQKMIFLVENNEGYTLSIASEPMPSYILPMKAEIKGNRLEAIGRSIYISGEIPVTLEFEEDRFTGSINFPYMGETQFSGQRGRGPSLSEELIPLIKPYRKSEVKKRSEEEIRLEVEKLAARMSLEDKIGQMSQIRASVFDFGADIPTDPPEQMVAEGKAGSILGAFDSKRVFELQKIAVEQSPHGIPLLFNADVIHGFQTIFPVPLAWSCSWDLEGIKQACAIGAKEAAVAGTTYNHAPMVDISRDPRWGRVVEGSGEDPYLGSLIAKAQVEGFQGDLFNRETLIACLKHFIAYGAAEGGRDYNTVDISEGVLRNVYLPPFKAGIEAGAASVMNSFNIYDGIPVAGSSYLLRDLLRKELGFDGILISDYGSIAEICVHGAAQNEEEATKLTVNATMDIEMASRLFATHLPKLIEDGLVKEEQLDEAVQRILSYKFKIGIMDDPFRYLQPEKEAEYNFSEPHLEASRDLGRKSIVLLKNDGILPLREEEKTIALIGPFSASRDLLGPWQYSRFGLETATLKQGVLAKGIKPEQLLVATGCEVNNEIEGGFERAIACAKQADVVVLALGEDSDMSGEAASRVNIELPSVQQRLAEEIVKLGKPTILVLTNGRPLILDWFDKNVSAIVETWFLGSQAGHAIADVLFGDYNPSGRLTMTFPKHAGQVPVYYNHFVTGRPITQENRDTKYISKYLDCPNDPLYPFGYGLSYTKFEYGEIRLDKTILPVSGALTASVRVTNVGIYAGEETVQLYIRDLYGSVVRPVKELKGFKKLILQPGESQTVSFTITEDDLKFYTKDGSFQAEKGWFKVYIGSNSKDVQEGDFELL